MTPVGTTGVGGAQGICFSGSALPGLVEWDERTKGGRCDLPKPAIEWEVSLPWKAVGSGWSLRSIPTQATHGGIVGVLGDFAGF